MPDAKRNPLIGAFRAPPEPAPPESKALEAQAAAYGIGPEDARLTAQLLGPDDSLGRLFELDPAVLQLLYHGHLKAC